MKRSKLITPILTLVCILGLYGVAFSGGGEGGAASCDTPPLLNSGPFLYGTFTVARDKSVCGLAPGSPLNGYDVQVMLEYKFKQVHLFSFHSPLGTGDLCGYEASQLETAYASLPCQLGVAEAFGFDPAKYFPVISDINILKKDFCKADICNPQNPNYLVDCKSYTVLGQTIYYSPDEMISGLITIRLKPIKK